MIKLITTYLQELGVEFKADSSVISIPCVTRVLLQLKDDRVLTARFDNVSAVINELSPDYIMLAIDTGNGSIVISQLTNVTFGPDTLMFTGEDLRVWLYLGECHE